MGGAERDRPDAETERPAHRHDRTTDQPADKIAQPETATEHSAPSGSAKPPQR